MSSSQLDVAHALCSEYVEIKVAANRHRVLKAHRTSSLETGVFNLSFYIKVCWNLLGSLFWDTYSQCSPSLLHQDTEVYFGVFHSMVAMSDTVTSTWGCRLACSWGRTWPVLRSSSLRSQQLPTRRGHGWQEHARAVLQQLCWLPFGFWVQFKALALIAFKPNVTWALAERLPAFLSQHSN